MICDSIDIKNLRKVLLLHNSLDPSIRNVLGRTYSKYYVENNFRISEEFPIKPKYDKNEDIDINKKLFDSVFDYDNKKPLKTKSQMAGIQDLLKDDVEEDLSKSKTSPKEKIINDVFLAITNQMEKFRLYVTFYTPYFKKNIRGINTGLKRTMEFYKNIIVLPGLYSLYTISYFAGSIDANRKYLLYQIVTLFLESYSYFINKVEEMFDLNSFKNIQVLNKYLNICERNNDKSLTDIHTFIKNTTIALQQQIKTINTDKFEQLNVKAVFEIYFIFIFDFKYVADIIKVDLVEKKDVKIGGNLGTKIKTVDKPNLNNTLDTIGSSRELMEIAEEEKKEDIDLVKLFSDDIQSVIEEYTSYKTNFFGDNIFYTFFRNDDVMYDSLKNIIVQDLFLRLERENELFDPKEQNEDGKLKKFRNFFDPLYIEAFDNINCLFSTSLFHCKTIIVEQQANFVKRQIIYILLL